MSYLDEMVCYLIGAIDRVSDDGIGWRKELRGKCKIKKLGIKFLDPTEKPVHIGQEIGEEKHKVKKLIADGNWDEAREIVIKIRHYDLRMVDTSHFVIACIDMSTHMCGSYDEIFTAERQQKPILILMRNGTRKDIPAWLVSFIKQDEVFDSIDELVQYLSDIDNGLIKTDNRWVDFKLSYKKV